MKFQTFLAIACLRKQMTEWKRAGSILMLLAVAALAGCTALETPLPPVTDALGDFKLTQKSPEATFANKEALARFEDDGDPIYRLGAGDKLNINVWGRPELSGHRIVGPDGRITMPVGGDVMVAFTTRDGAAQAISESIKPYYTIPPQIAVEVEQYTANRIVILGRVGVAGTITFDGNPTLLEALARAQALPVLDKKATLTRCVVIRGRDKLVWVDLKRMLSHGDMAYNIRLKPNDLIYIPDSDDTQVYVLGFVSRPGAYSLKPDMTLLDVLAQAGGPTEDAAPEYIAVYRPHNQSVHTAPLRALLSGDPKVNVVMEEGDIVYVPRSGIASFGYFMRQIVPGATYFAPAPATVGTSTK